jgi:hypothetical protein
MYLSTAVIENLYNCPRGTSDVRAKRQRTTSTRYTPLCRRSSGELHVMLCNGKGQETGNACLVREYGGPMTDAAPRAHEAGVLHVDGESRVETELTTRISAMYCP